MSETLSRLQELLDRKESVTSKMDSFQIAEEIGQTTVSILRSIFEPYKLEEVPIGDLTRTPDAMLKYDALGRTKNRVFFEIKAGRIAYYDLKMIREMMRELKAVYASRFYSLVFIARSFDSEIVSRVVKERTRYPGKLTLISTETLVSLYQKLMFELEFKDARNKRSVLLNLLEAEGVVSSKVISEYVKPPEEYSFEMLKLSAFTRDQVPVDLNLSLKTVLMKDRSRESTAEGKEIAASEEAKRLISSEIKEVAGNHSLLEFAFDPERTLRGLREELSDTLRKQGLEVSKFECGWQFDERTRTNVERSRQLIYRSEPLRREIDVLDKQLTEAYLNLRAQVTGLGDNLNSLEANYVHGTIAESDYLEQIDKVGNKITALKARIKEL